MDELKMPPFFYAVGGAIIGGLLSVIVALNRIAVALEALKP